MEDIGSNDVLLGRGGATNTNLGNRRYRTIVADHQAEYLRARKKDKILIAREIVSIVKSNGGRFLKRNSADVWTEVTDRRATEKTSQALREGLDVRNKKIRTNKQVRLRPSDSDKIVTGHIAPSSPALVSLSNDGYVPDLQDENHFSQMLPVVKLDPADIKNPCEV